MKRWWGLWLAYSAVTLFALAYAAGPRGRWPAKRWIVPAVLLILPPVVLFAWGVRTGFFQGEREGRLRRRLCPQCGYDVRATPDRCPECGATGDLPAPVFAAVGPSEKDPVMKPGAQTIQVGGIYATPADKDGSWRVVRVLALDEHAVHLRSYSDRFNERPKDVDLAKLDWVIGHMPLSRDGFDKEQRVLIKVVPVAEDELEGYRYYLEAMNGGPPPVE